MEWEALLHGQLCCAWEVSNSFLPPAPSGAGWVLIISRPFPRYSGELFFPAAFLTVLCILCVFFPKLLNVLREYLFC